MNWQITAIWTVTVHVFRRCSESITIVKNLFFFRWCCCPTLAMVLSCLLFLAHTQRRTTLGRNPLDEVSASHWRLPDNTQHLQRTNIQAADGIWTYNLSRRSPADLCLRQRGYRERPIIDTWPQSQLEKYFTKFWAKFQKNMLPQHSNLAPLTCRKEDVSKQ